MLADIDIWNVGMEDDILGSQASRLSHSQAGLQLKRGDPSAFMVLSEGSFGNDGKTSSRLKGMRWTASWPSPAILTAWNGFMHPRLFSRIVKLRTAPMAG